MKTDMNEIAESCMPCEWVIRGWTVLARSLDGALAEDVGNNQSLLSAIMNERFDLDVEVAFRREENEGLDEDDAYAMAEESMDIEIRDTWSDMKRDMTIIERMEIMGLEWGRDIEIVGVECHALICSEMVQLEPLVCDDCSGHYCLNHKENRAECYCGHESETVDVIAESIDFFQTKANADNGGKVDDITKTDTRGNRSLG